MKWESFWNQSPYPNTVGKTAEEQREKSHDSQSVLSLPLNGNRKTKSFGSCSSVFSFENKRLEISSMHRIETLTL